MATMTIPPKFVELKNSHLICPVCHNVYNEPVINVKCGHTFCRECIQKQTWENNSTKCSIDGETCNLDLLVINRALQSQIDDLDVYCTHGLSWSSEKNEYIPDPQRCSQIIKYSHRKEHENTCEHAIIACPNNEKLCGRIKRKDLSEHLEKCQHFTCHYRQKGCDFTGPQQSLANHMSNCGYRGLQAVGTDAKKVVELEAENRAMKVEINCIKQRLESLEKAKEASDQRLEMYISLVRSLQQRIATGPETHVVRRSASAYEIRRKSGELVRSPSTGSTNLRSPKVENWTMPFQFKCIGTLRGHKDPVWSLKSKSNWLFSAGDDQVIKVWDLENLVSGCQQTLSGHVDKIHVLAVGEQFLYSGGADLAIIQWNIHDRSIEKQIEKAHDDIIAAMECTEDCLFTSSHQVIKVWDAISLEHLHTITSQHHWVRSLALNITKDRLYSGSHNNIEVWNTSENYNLIAKISHQHGSSHSLAVTEKYIIAGTYNQNIHLFDIDNYQYIMKLTGHVGVIMSLACSSSGRFLFSASSDATVQIWNLENKLPIMALTRHEGSVNTLVIHNDLLLSGSEDSEIKVFKYFKMQPGFVPS